MTVTYRCIGDAKCYSGERGLVDTAPNPARRRGVFAVSRETDALTLSKKYQSWRDVDEYRVLCHELLDDLQDVISQHDHFALFSPRGAAPLVSAATSASTANVVPRLTVQIEGVAVPQSPVAAQATMELEAMRAFDAALIARTNNPQSHPPALSRKRRPSVPVLRQAVFTDVPESTGGRDSHPFGARISPLGHQCVTAAPGDYASAPENAYEAHAVAAAKDAMSAKLGACNVIFE